MTEVCSPRTSGPGELPGSRKDPHNDSVTSIESGDDTHVETGQPSKKRSGRMKNRRMSQKRKALHINFSPSGNDPKPTGSSRQPNPNKSAKAGASNAGSDKSHQFVSRPWLKHHQHHRQKNFFKRARPLNASNFLFGGNTRDPLNLAGLMEKGSRGTTPATSPYPRKHESPALIPIPRFKVEDPLNLRSEDDALPPPLPHPRRHKRRRRESVRVGDVEAIAENEKKSRRTMGQEFYLESLSDTEVAVMHSPPADSQKKVTAKKQVAKQGSPASPSTPPPQKRARLGSNAQRSSGGRRDGNDPIVSPVPQRPMSLKPTSPLKPSPVLERKPFHHHQSTDKKGQRKHKGHGGVKKDTGTDESGAEDAKNQIPKIKKDPSRFKYGNYNQYYGKRLPDETSDPRFSYIKKQWIQGKCVLDIGCNIGHVTILLARDWGPSTILGLDIDSKLIGIARKNIRHYLDEANSKKFREKTANSEGETGSESTNIQKVDDYDISKFPPSFAREYGPLSGPAALGPSLSFSKHPSIGKEKSMANQTEGSESAKDSNPCSTSVTVSERLTDSQARSSADPEDPTTENPKPEAEAGGAGGSLDLLTSDFPRNIVFRTENFVLETDDLLENIKPAYDTILALSVTKWIHLNWGDAGIKRFFKRIFKTLRPGGRFILEPQPWEGYNKRKKLSEEIRQNYQSIRLKPENFESFLLGPEIGFKSCESIGTPPQKSKAIRDVDSSEEECLNSSHS